MFETLDSDTLLKLAKIDDAKSFVEMNVNLISAIAVFDSAANECNHNAGSALTGAQLQQLIAGFGSAQMIVTNACNLAAEK